jgi:acyl carrier protein
MGAKTDAAWHDVAAWVRAELVPDCSEPVVETTPLISSGLLDSYSVVELIAHVEARFDVEVAPCWHRVEHLDTLERIAGTVERIRQQRRP